MHTTFRGLKWNVDLWFLRSMDGVSDKFMKKIKPLLTPEKREIILNIKAQVIKENFVIASYIIYEAVIFNNVTDFDQLIKYCKFEQELQG